MWSVLSYLMKPKKYFLLLKILVTVDVGFCRYDEEDAV